MNPKLQRARELACELLGMFPGKNCVELRVGNYGEPNEIEIGVALHGHKTYAEATEELRSLGIGERQKTPYAFDGGMAYTQLEGKSDGVRVVTYPNELPPSCHIETVIEKIPKQQTVDTGEFIEVERKKVVCG